MGGTPRLSGRPAYEEGQSAEVRVIALLEGGAEGLQGGGGDVVRGSGHGSQTGSRLEAIVRSGRWLNAHGFPATNILTCVCGAVPRGSQTFISEIINRSGFNDQGYLRR